MNHLVLVSVAALGASLPAQQFFQRHRQQFDESATGAVLPYSVYGVQFADIDGDGDRDVVALVYTGCCGPNRVFGYTNDGSGNFGPHVDLGLTVNRTLAFQDIAIADLNGDGVDDFVVDDSGPLVWLSNGPTTWSTVPCPVAGPGLRFADVDGDGDLDWVVPGNPIRLVRNDGGGFVEPFTSLALVPGSATVAVGDADGDGDIDILTATALLTQLGPMQWLPSAALSPSAGYQGAGAGLVDVDGDGDLDVLGPTAYWRNSGVGTFTNATPSLPAGAQRFFDWDGDGFVDVGVGSQVYRNDGTGTFVLQPGWSSAPPSARFSVTATGDANGDGKPDVVGGTSGDPAGGRSTSSTWGTLSLALNDGARFVEVTGHGLHHQETNTACALAGDVDGDGDADVLLLNDLAIRPSMLLLNQWGAFDDAVPGPSSARALGPGSLLQRRGALVDLDGDGDADVVGPTGDVWRNDGAGHYTSVLLLRSSPAVENVAAGDLDGDGDVDLVLVGNGSNQVFRNNGSAVFQAVGGALPASTDTYNLPVLGDFDGDGDLDLFVGTISLSSTVQSDHLFFNNGSGVFVELAGRLPAPVPSITPDAIAVDLDGDGDLDILTAQGPYYRNTGAGSFVAVPLPVPGGTHVAADFDEDGDLDVATYSFGFGSCRVCYSRNDGAGTFTTSPNQVLLGGTPATLTAIDSDGDLDVDLLATSIGEFLSDGAVPTILTNSQRDLDAPSHLRIGATFEVSVTSRAPVGGSHAALLAAGVPLPTRTLLPQIGWLALDPSTLLVLGFMVLPAANPAQKFTIPVPADPVLLGATLGFQALVGTSGTPHLTNAVVETVVR